MGQGPSRCGYRRDQGRIIGDDQAFDDEGLGPGWAWDYLDAGYAAPIGALQYNENIADVTATPATVAGDPVVAPARSRQRTHDRQPRRGRSRPRRGADTIDIHRRVDRPEIEITGMMPLGAATVRGRWPW